jgi:uroporphyrinogen-III decarboxylase
VTSRDRLLTALARGKPDRLPVSVHQWQTYHLETYLGGISALEAFRRFGLDAQIQYDDRAGRSDDEGSLRARTTREWRVEPEILSGERERRVVRYVVTTPEGRLTWRTESDAKTTWTSEYPVKRDEDIELIRKYMPVASCDLRAVEKLAAAVGDGGIVRGTVWGDQAGCWQHACCLADANDLILATFDKPDWVRRFLEILLEKKLSFIESMKGARFDLVETGGGAASSTLISPALHAAFCLPFDRRLHDALHGLGFKVVYHTCGGTRGIEDSIVANGCDASETLAPPSIGGNQEPWEFAARAGGRLALIGGLDQSGILTEGTPGLIRAKVRELFERVGGQGGYILSPSDHFFDARPENIEAYAEAGRACRY